LYLQLFAIKLQKFLLTAIHTVTQDSQVPEVCAEFIFPEQSTLQGSQQRLIKVNYGTTFLADEVMMVSLLSRMVSNSTFPQVSLGDQTKPFKQFQSTIDGRDINIRVFGYHLSIDFLSTDMIFAILDSRKYHHPLRRQPISLPAQFADHIPGLFHLTPPN
jgi:hypothetical protein